MNSTTEAPRRAKSGRPKEEGSERDAERLMARATQLLLSAGRRVTDDALVEGARSTPCSMKESRLGSCGCALCARLMIEIEGHARASAAYRRFVELVKFFFDEVPGWGVVRRAKAEAAMAESLGAEVDG